jgi:hypothetical protein
VNLLATSKTNKIGGSFATSILEVQMTTKKRKIVAISASPTKVRVKQQASVGPKESCAETKPTVHPDCSDPGPAGFDFSEDEAERALTSYRVF